ncbi:MAG: type I-C CRISPR-associated protein Cas8c/Csd1, partial [Undibacterium sp.]|nr:type I-C CRISPR-associated protein Cas8c/Csd1 [Opitutaceae bacterium]
EAARLAVKTAFEAQKLKVSDWVTFQVEGHDGYLIEWAPLKSWWREHCTATRTANTAESTEPLIPCIVTGQLCAPVRTHGTRIKVAPGGLPGGVALVSSDKPAFGSYGFEKSLVSPMSEVAVEGYIRAINYLGDKAHPDHHHRTADTIFLFWCERPELTANPAKAIEEGAPELTGNWLLDDLTTAPPLVPLSDSPIAAKDTFGSPNAGALTAGSDAAAARFYCLALSGSSARGVIRSWIDQPLKDAVSHMRDWFDDLTIPLDRAIYDPRDAKIKDQKKRRVLAAAGDLYSRWPLWRLVSSLEGKGDSSAELARQRTLLFSCALLGRNQPVPLELIAVACRRIATTGECPPPRAALIQFLLRRYLLQQQKLKFTTMSDIDQSIQNSRPFLCGRLLRILESAQYYAVGDVNATVVDKFYSAASATPGSVFGLLMAKLHDHLAKAKKSPKQNEQRAAGALTNRVAEISAQLADQGGFPKTFSPEEQGAFALGFYSEKIRRRKEDPAADEKLDEVIPDKTSE